MIIGAKFWPRRLSSQMALLVAIALFVAQAINLSLLLEGRRQLRLQQLVGPVVTLVVDASERIANGQLEQGDDFRRGRVRLLPQSTVRPMAMPAPDLENALRPAFAEAGLHFSRIETEIRPVSMRDRRLAHFSRQRAARYARFGREVVLALERPDGRWLVLGAPWASNNSWLFWQLLGQTAILYVIILLPMLWAVGHISRPLQSLAEAARQYRPADDTMPLAERGPQDVRAVIAAFNALTRRVGAMLNEKDRMLGAIGHDLRTPLAALRVRVESVDDDANRDKMVETITEMNRTLDDILSLARLGRPSEPLTTVDLTALVDAVVDDFRAIGNPVELAEGGRVTTLLRPSLMRRALRNLIENAVKYGGSAQVSIAEDSRRIAIVVADRGPGIPAEALETVFDPFTRLERSRNRETGGIGLGLALARAIARDAGGDITLANRAEGGLLATITLPRT